MGRRNSINSSALSFWAGAFLVLIIVGVFLFVWNSQLYPIIIAFRLALIAVGLAGLAVIALLSRGSGPDAREIACDILARQKALYSGPHDYEPATADEFPDLDRSYYDSMRAAFEALGFKYVEDVENVTLSRAFPAFRTFVRTMIGDNDGIVARIFQLRPLGRAGRDIRVIELSTELSDFTFLVTTTAQVFLDATQTHGIVTQQLPPETAPAEVLRQHREALAAAIAKSGSVSVVACPNLQEILKSARHAHAVRSVHRKRFGYVTRNDLKMIRGEPLTELDQRIFEEINSIESKERAAEQANQA